MSRRISFNTKRSMDYSTDDRREKVLAISLAKECYSMKLGLLTNATVVDGTIRFISHRSNEKLKSCTEGDKEESQEPDYDEDEDQLEEGQEEETGELVSTTMNEVF